MSGPPITPFPAVPELRASGGADGCGDGLCAVPDVVEREDRGEATDARAAR
ncbi:hypothetical protein [Georgenia satyanarayanai]|uniref:hypothetical protein n=1 Tax=Georgenia satyanarayanai TaxID=860221 RepID=UPI00186ABE2C|nr:hypothetical protein [Georgenia satyanarayanai]